MDKTLSAGDGGSTVQVAISGPRSWWSGSGGVTWNRARLVDDIIKLSHFGVGRLTVTSSHNAAIVEFYFPDFSLRMSTYRDTERIEPESVLLPYTIASATPHSGPYRPENIIPDRPTDPSSRWSGAFQGSNQYVTLKLDSVSILRTITFGKHAKPHPCNIREFKVFVGMTEDDMTEVLHAGLKNDTIPETFNIQIGGHSDVPSVTQFIKIVPLSAHGHQRFHTSIWHIALKGINDPEYVQGVRASYEEYRESIVLRHILKHLRQRRLLTPYQTILSRANIQLEHPLITHLHENLVLQGNWARSEQLLEQISGAGLLNDYLRTHQLHSSWTKLEGKDYEGQIPPARGGHAMCMDPINQDIYIFGGYNGQSSLDDFWVYHVPQDRWECLSRSTSQEQNAPGARSCHKMVFDTKTGNIYTLGRLHDPDEPRPPQSTVPQFGRGTNSSGINVGPSGYPQPDSATVPQIFGGVTPGPMYTSATTPPDHHDTSDRSSCSEFFRYHTRGLDKGKWDFLSFDTAASGGPPLVFDHQMVMDAEAQMLYVFGGRVAETNGADAKYSGLYSYNVKTTKWKLLQNSETHGSQIVIPPRFGHSMVLDPKTKILYIFAGQRGDDFLSDMYEYDIKTGITTELFSNFTAAGGPEACYMQRAVIDPSLKEIYVFCGLTRRFPNNPRNTLSGYVSNWMYSYAKRPGQWSQILQEPEQSPDIPVPRFAHQVVYSPATESVFVHGGNAGGPHAIDPFARTAQPRDADGNIIASISDEEADKAKQMRLSDFWRMELKRPTVHQVLRQAKFLIRKQQFREMCQECPPVKVLQFLQTEVSSVVDHTNAQETAEFRSLLTYLLRPSASPSSSYKAPNPASSSLDGPSSPTSLKHGGTRDRNTRPRKRSRSSLDGDLVATSPISGSSRKSPAADSSDSDENDQEEEHWTNEIPALIPEPVLSTTADINLIRETIDPFEDMIREHQQDVTTIVKSPLTSISSPTIPSSTPSPLASPNPNPTASNSRRRRSKLPSSTPQPTNRPPPSGDRYAERTRVFESLLRFVSDDAKQPNDNLIDLVEPRYSYVGPPGTSGGFASSSSKHGPGGDGGGNGPGGGEGGEGGPGGPPPPGPQQQQPPHPAWRRPRAPQTAPDGSRTGGGGGSGSGGGGPSTTSANATNPSPDPWASLPHGLSSEQLAAISPSTRRMMAFEALPPGTYDAIREHEAAVAADRARGPMMSNLERAARLRASRREAMNRDANTNASTGTSASASTSTASGTGTGIQMNWNDMVTMNLQMNAIMNRALGPTGTPMAVDSTGRVDTTTTPGPTTGTGTAGTGDTAEGTPLSPPIESSE